MGLKNKYVIAIGDEAVVSGEGIMECVKTAGALDCLCYTVCYECNPGGVINPEMQAEIIGACEKYGADNIVVVLGGGDGEGSSLAAETVITGDPAGVGPLADKALGLEVYSIFEPEIKDQLDQEVYEGYCATLEIILDIDDIIAQMNDVRGN